MNFKQTKFSLLFIQSCGAHEDYLALLLWHSFETIYILLKVWHASGFFRMLFQLTVIFQKVLLDIFSH